MEPKNQIDRNNIHEENDTDSQSNKKKVAQSIINAAQILYFSLGLSLINDLLLKYFSRGNYPAGNYGPGIVIFALLFNIFLFYMVLKGKNWARITTLVLTILGTFILIPTLAAYFTDFPLIGIVSLICAGLQIYACVLLFNKESKAWYLKQILD